MKSTTATLENRVLRFIRQEQVFAAPGGVLAACSGGADSLCLLAMLKHWSSKLGLELAAAWFDHGLRPAQAAGECDRVKAFARRLDVPLRTGRGDTRLHASEQGMSIEEAARDLRYRFLAETCREMGFDTIATGHTADDNAETVLLHILRGCGIDGLAGLRPLSPLPVAGREFQSILLVRPLLILGRADTEAYCGALKFKFVRDASNRSPRYLRNRIRHELLPLLEELNPGIRRSLARLSEAATESMASFAREALDWPMPSIRADGSVTVVRKDVAQMPPAVRTTFLRAALQTLLPGLKDVNACHLRSLAGLATGGGGRTINLPGNITASAQGESIYVRRTAGNKPGGVEKQVDTRLAVPGVTHFGEWIITAAVTKPPIGRSATGRAFFDAEAAGTGLTVGAWRKGDRLQPLGMSGEKKLQDLFTDAKIARPLRGKLPVIRSAGRVLWVPGVRQAEWARVKPESKSLLRITCRRLP